ncbi:hypothetical protein CDAR_78291 [Caerostris darwini]|uniref:Uncharacterized protein n=1 Tax=Caerostris darwini TaxID=1538125 RepID=A0AAV4SG98_9ARAC|nr:hypothetical protein CDAR_78291 [Caerostris darwini]
MEYCIRMYHPRLDCIQIALYDYCIYSVASPFGVNTDNSFLVVYCLLPVPEGRTQCPIDLQCSSLEKEAFSSALLISSPKFGNEKRDHTMIVLLQNQDKYIRDFFVVRIHLQKCSTGNWTSSRIRQLYRVVIK